ncbi:MqnA/MqnD/SBP family protein [Anaerococcus sp. Marseille-Q7828]|uniref:ABC transporter substrate-binding protein n=1 Tax=Anaerococcus sp. Marseille-Q7828 TaxID=3036300 RepID=UPI0024AE862A|nr:MqnA/MqnD/SBP family protein [Anaerococcus sp. Marseille-Q7828]
MKIKNKSLVLLLALALVGCGNQGQTNNENTEIEQKEDTSSTTEDSKEVKEEKVEDDNQEDAKHYDANLSMLAGPTSVGAINMVEESKNGESNFTINESVDGAPDALVPKLVSGEADLAIIPANLAATLYNKTEGKVKVLSTNSLGVLYVVTKGDVEINSIEDLANYGEEILASGKGATPEIAINKILETNGYSSDNLNINYLVQANEAAQKLIAGEAKVAILPEPMVSSVLLKAEDAKVAINLNELYEDATGYPIISSVLVGRSEYLDTIDVEKLLDTFKNSIEKAKANPDETATLLEKYDIMPAPVAKKAIPNLALEYIDGDKLKEIMAKHLEDLNNTNPQLIGGSIPEDDFYFTK